MSWGKLKKAYTQEGLVLAIGAGVSKASKLPTWEELFRRVGKACLKPHEMGLVGDLKAQGLTLPAIASVLRVRCGTEQSFTDLVRDALYQKFEPYKKLKARSRGGHANATARNLKLELVRKAGETNSSLRTVAALCVLPGATSSGYRRNPHIHAIVNFNLDAVLRTYVEARYGEAFVRTVERPSKTPDPEKKISVYHAHGFLRFDQKANEPASESFDKLVLTEQHYFDFTNNPTGIFTYTFLYLLREYRCLFIGLSMQDENIRRLLHYLRKERVAAYKEERRYRGREEEKATRHFAVLELCKRNKPLNDAIARSLWLLGVNVLWVDSFAQLPDRMGKMYSAYDNWSKVYG